MNVSVCIATYRRPERLAVLLEDLRSQQCLPDQVVVVDNDARGSARPVIEKCSAATVPFALDYDIQPHRNIALTRNRTVELARGDWIAFIDDDERAPAQWLRRLLESAVEHAADGVLGPVEPEIPAAAPGWIRRGRFYDFPRSRTGALIPLNRMRFGNVLLRGECLRAEPGPFDIRYGLATGEDGDLLVRLARKGARIIWCDSASVREPIEGCRLSLRWLLRRALSGGQEFAHQTIRGAYERIGPLGKVRCFTRAFLQLAIAIALSLVCLPAGRHRAVAWLMKAAANLGKLTAFWGWRYRAYA
jgi:succinoglycan biosynthesis protein ExoM